MWYPQNYVKILVVKYRLIPNNTCALAGAIKKTDFLGVCGELPQKLLGDQIAFTPQQLYAEIRFRCFVVKGEEGRTRFRKKKKGKKSSSRPKVVW